MDGGGRRQLPSWMMKSAANEQASVSETNGDNKENGSVETLFKAVKPQKVVQGKKDDEGIPSNDNKLQLVKDGQTRTSRRKSNKVNEVEGGRFQEDEPHVLKPCKKRRSTKLLTKNGENRADDLVESDAENEVDGVARKRVRKNVPRKESRKLEEAYNVREESGPSEDELTVEDLISIAEEYVKADREEFQKSKNLENEPVKKVKKPLPRANSRIGSDKDLTSNMGTRLDTDQPPSSDSSSTNPLSSKGGIINQSTTFDPAQDMLDLFLGPWLKKSKEVETKIDPVAEKIEFNYELSKRSGKNNDVEVAPVMKKKFSLKENLGKLMN